MIDLTEAVAAFKAAWGGADADGRAGHRTEAGMAAAAPRIEAQVRKNAATEIEALLAAHNIECTGPGEVTCRGCREIGWMSWTAYRHHIATFVALGATS